jgi:hypothetical protein
MRSFSGGVTLGSDFTTRLALSPTKCMKSADIKDLFAFLVTSPHADCMLLDAITDGLSAPVVSRLLAQTDRWLQATIRGLDCAACE